MSKSGPVIGAVAGMLLVVGGVAAAQAFTGEDTPAPKPSVVQPVVDVPEVTTTTATPTVAPKPAKKAATTTSATAPKIERKTVRAQQAPEPPVSEPEPVTPEPTGTATLRQPPPVIPGNGPRICGTTACTTQ